MRRTVTQGAIGKAPRERFPVPQTWTEFSLHPSELSPRACFRAKPPAARNGSPISSAPAEAPSGARTARRSQKRAPCISSLYCAAIAGAGARLVEVQVDLALSTSQSDVVRRLLRAVEQHAALHAVEIASWPEQLPFAPRYRIVHDGVAHIN